MSADWWRRAAVKYLAMIIGACGCIAEIVVLSVGGQLDRVGAIAWPASTLCWIGIAAMNRSMR